MQDFKMTVWRGNLAVQADDSVGMLDDRAQIVVEEEHGNAIGVERR